MATKIFPGVIFAEESGFSINFPDIPGAHSEGDTIEDCIAMGQEALNLILETMADDKKEIPAASSVDAARAAALETYPEGKVLTVQFITGTIPERAQKYTITMEPELMKRVDAAAGNYGRSGWLATAAREKLSRAVALGAADMSGYFAEMEKAVGNREWKPLRICTDNRFDWAIDHVDGGFLIHHVEMKDRREGDGVEVGNPQNLSPKALAERTIKKAIAPLKRTPAGAFRKP